MTVVILVFICLLALLVGALRLHKAIDRTHERFRRLTSGYREAGQLVANRERFRARQQRVENILDTGTVGVQAAHRSLAGLFGGGRGSGAGVYDSLRAINRSVGRSVSSVFAPTPQKPGESRAELRAPDSGQDKR